MFFEKYLTALKKERQEGALTIFNHPKYESVSSFSHYKTTVIMTVGW